MLCRQPKDRVWEPILHLGTLKGWDFAALTCTQLSICDSGALWRIGLGKAARPLTFFISELTKLPQAASFGVEAELIRFSVGLEDTPELTETFKRALASLS